MCGGRDFVRKGLCPGCKISKGVYVHVVKNIRGGGGLCPCLQKKRGGGGYVHLYSCHFVCVWGGGGVMSYTH